MALVLISPENRRHAAVREDRAGCLPGFEAFMMISDSSSTEYTWVVGAGDVGGYLEVGGYFHGCQLCLSLLTLRPRLYGWVPMLDENADLERLGVRDLRTGPVLKIYGCSSLSVNEVFLVVRGAQGDGRRPLLLASSLGYRWESS